MISNHVIVKHAIAIRCQRAKFFVMTFQLFTQSLLICSTTAFTTVVYSYLELFPAPRGVIIAANVVWQLSHGKEFLFAQQIKLTSAPKHSCSLLCNSLGRSLETELSSCFIEEKNAMRLYTMII